MNIVKRIVGWFSLFYLELVVVVGIFRNDQVVANLTSAWMKSSRIDFHEFPDPATCVKYRLKGKFVAIFSSMLCYLLLWFACTHFCPERATVLIGFSFLVVSTFVCYFTWPTADGGIWWKRTKIVQALDFVRAIDWAVRAQDHAEKKISFSLSGCMSPGSINRVMSFLQDWASRIDSLGQFPWRAKEKDREFNLWKRAHHLLRRLYGNVLPEDYLQYFPKKSSS